MGKEKRGQQEKKGNGCKKQRREHDDDEEADAADTTEESSYNPKKAKGNNGNRVSQARGGPDHQVSQNKPCISTSVEMQEAFINMTNSHNHSINEECTLLCSQEASRRKKGRSEPSRPAKMIPPHDESMALGVDVCDPNLTAYSLPLFNPMLLAVHEMPPIKVDIFDDPLKSKKKGDGGSNKTNVDDNTSSDNGMIDTSSRTLFRGGEDDNGVDNLAHCSKVFHPPLHPSSTGIHPLTHPLMVPSTPTSHPPSLPHPSSLTLLPLQACRTLLPRSELLPACLAARGITDSVTGSDAPSLDALMYFGDQDVNAIDFEAHNALPHERARDVKDVILNVSYHLFVSISNSFFCSSAFSCLVVPSHMLYSILSHPHYHTLSPPPSYTLPHTPTTTLSHPPSYTLSLNPPLSPSPENHRAWH